MKQLNTWSVMIVQSFSLAGHISYLHKCTKLQDIQLNMAQKVWGSSTFWSHSFVTNYDYAQSHSDNNSSIVILNHSYSYSWSTPDAQQNVLRNGTILSLDRVNSHPEYSPCKHGACAPSLFYTLSTVTCQACFNSTFLPTFWWWYKPADAIKGWAKQCAYKDHDVCYKQLPQGNKTHTGG